MELSLAAFFFLEPSPAILGHGLGVDRERENFDRTMSFLWMCIEFVYYVSLPSAELRRNDDTMRGAGAEEVLGGEQWKFAIL